MLNSSFRCDKICKCHRCDFGLTLLRCSSRTQIFNKPSRNNNEYSHFIFIFLLSLFSYSEQKHEGFFQNKPLKSNFEKSFEIGNSFFICFKTFFFIHDLTKIRNTVIVQWHPQRLCDMSLNHKCIQTTFHLDDISFKTLFCLNNIK